MKKAASITPDAGRVVRVSWCFLFVALTLGWWASTRRHRQLGTGDPVYLLVGLCFVALVAAFVFGVIAVSRGIRCGAVKTILCASFPLLVAGGLLATFSWLNYR